MEVLLRGDERACRRAPCASALRAARPAFPRRRSAARRRTRRARRRSAPARGRRAAGEAPASRRASPAGARVACRGSVPTDQVGQEERSGVASRTAPASAEREHRSSAASSVAATTRGAAPGRARWPWADGSCARPARRRARRPRGRRASSPIAAWRMRYGLPSCRDLVVGRGRGGGRTPRTVAASRGADCRRARAPPPASSRAR